MMCFLFRNKENKMLFGPPNKKAQGYGRSQTWLQQQKKTHEVSTQGPLTVVICSSCSNLKTDGLVLYLCLRYFFFLSHCKPDIAK